MITKTVVTDIFNLGYSVINKGPARDLDKMFQNTPANVTEESQETNVTNIQDLSEILSMTAKLSRNVQMMELDVRKSHDINSRLRSDLSQCQDKIEALNNELHALKLQYESLSQNAPVDSHSNANILVRRSSGDHSYISTDDTSGFEYRRHHTKRLIRRRKKAKQTKDNTTPPDAQVSAVSRPSGTPHVVTQSVTPHNTSQPATTHRETKQMYVGGVNPECSTDDLSVYMAALQIPTKPSDIAPLADTST